MSRQAARMEAPRQRQVSREKPTIERTWFTVDRATCLCMNSGEKAKEAGEGSSAKQPSKVDYLSIDRNVAANQLTVSSITSGNLALYEVKLGSGAGRVGYPTPRGRGRVWVRPMVVD